MESMRERIFCFHEAASPNEWFRILPYGTTILMFKKRKMSIQPINYVTGLKKNIKIIVVPKYISREGKIATIKPIDHLVYTLYIILILPYILTYRRFIFITPPYYSSIITPLLRLFRKKVYVVSLDPQTRLRLTYEESRNPLIYLYMKLSFFLEDITIRLASKVFVVSKYLKNEYRRKSRNIFYTPNGADTERIKKIKKKRMFKEFTITYAGSFDSWRSVDLIIDAFKKLQENMKNVKLLLIGGGGNIEQIKKIAEGNEDVVITGWIKDNKDVIAYCKGSDVLLMTPRDNAMSKTVSSIKCFEYIACEVPLVVTKSGEHAELVRNLRVGIVSNPNSESVASGIKKLIEDRNVYNRYKENCKKYKNYVNFKETRKAFVEEIIKDTAQGGLV